MWLHWIWFSSTVRIRICLVERNRLWQRKWCWLPSEVILHLISVLTDEITDIGSQNEELSSKKKQKRITKKSLLWRVKLLVSRWLEKLSCPVGFNEFPRLSLNLNLNINRIQSFKLVSLRSIVFQNSNPFQGKQPDFCYSCWYRCLCVCVCVLYTITERDRDIILCCQSEATSSLLGDRSYSYRFCLITICTSQHYSCRNHQWYIYHRWFSADEHLAPLTYISMQSWVLLHHCMTVSNI
jgi:hypothetical protein